MLIPPFMRISIFFAIVPPGPSPFDPKRPPSPSVPPAASRPPDIVIDNQTHRRYHQYGETDNHYH
jgi:hypothetical protein